MGRYLFRLPDIGEGLAEAEIAAWHVKPGDYVKEDQSLVDVMTDKATVDMSSPITGFVKTVFGAVGQSIAVGAPLIEFEIEGEGNCAAEAATAAPTTTLSPVPDSVKPILSASENSPRESLSAALGDGDADLDKPVTSTNSRRILGEEPFAAPATRRRAYEHGIALQFVPGTGPGGRIRPVDLDAYIARVDDRTSQDSDRRPVKRAAINERKIIGLRRKIAEKMQESKRRIPHFSYVEEFDMTELEGLRKELNADRSSLQPKLTLLPFFIRALVLLQPEFPHINAQYDDTAGLLREFEAVHIGIATQTPKGLMVPVVRHAEARDLFDCARELLRLTEAARNGRATREELTGSTITLTSLGALGGISATPVINAPEVAIIGPNKLVERPIVQNGQIIIKTMMNVSSSFDHRIVDGHDAARFIQRLKRLIEKPTLLFLERP